MVALESRPMDACPIVCGRLSRRCQGMKKKDQGDADLAVGKPLSAASTGAAVSRQLTPLNRPRRETIRLQ